MISHKSLKLALSITVPLLITLVVIDVLYKNPDALTLFKNMDPKTWPPSDADVLSINWEQKSWSTNNGKKKRLVNTPYLSGASKIYERLGDDSKQECSYNINFEYDQSLKTDVLYTMENSVKEKFVKDMWTVAYDGEDYLQNSLGKFYRLEFSKNTDGDMEKIRIDVSTHNKVNEISFGYYWPVCSTLK